jgi:hypothetical protein
MSNVTNSKLSIRLSWVAALLAGVASLAGLVEPAVYAGDTLWASTQVRGNDLVTLVLAVPVLALSLVHVRRDSTRARLVWLGMLGYLVYGYAFYLFGLALNPLFPAYVAVFSISLFVLIVELVRTDPKAVSSRFSVDAPTRAVAGYLWFVAGFLGLMWSARVVSYLVSGRVPQDVVASGVKSAVVYAMDLSVLVPALAIAGLLLWRREAWGYVVGTVVLVKCTAYPLALLGMSAFAIPAGVSEDAYLAAFWALFSAASVFVFARLLGSIREEPLAQDRFGSRAAAAD